MFIVYFCGYLSLLLTCFHSSSQEIGWEEHVRNDLFASIGT